jgi:outer membrane protein assembly factor BamB
MEVRREDSGSRPSLKASLAPLVVAAAGVLAFAFAPKTNDRSLGQWLQFRGDRALTGHSSLKGRIRTPAVRWKQFVGARETLLSIQWNQNAKESLTPLPAADLGVDPRPAPDPDKPRGGYSRVGRFLHEEPGVQKLEFESGFEKYGTSADKSLPLFGRLFIQRMGKWEQVWQSEPIPLLYSPNLIVGDFDRDGRLDLAITPWYDLWLMDVATGKLKARTRFTPPGAESGRAYGYLGAFDLNKDGRDEFIILADFENHMEVIGWRGSELTVLWNRLVERGIGNKKTVFRPGAEPIQDVDGDGQLEIIVTMFNAGGDNRWHVLVLDGMTGATKLDLPDQYLTGARDVDGDGTAELFCARAPGALVPSPSDLTVFGFKNGKLTTRWQTQDADFQTHVLPEMPPNVTNGTSTGGLTILAESVAPNKSPVFFTRRTLDAVAGTTELTAWRAASGSGMIRQIASWKGPHLEAVTTPGLMLRAQVVADSTGAVRGWGGSLRPVFSRRTGIPTSTPVVAKLTGSSSPAVVVQGAGERVIAFHPPGRQRWSLPGRAMRTGGESAGGVVLADVQGDGTLEVITATRGPGGCARLAAISPEGKLVWTRDFGRFPGSPPPHNIGGLTYWFAGRFTDVRRDDVLVSLRRSTMHSDETYLLDGRTGEPIWHQTEGSRATGRHVRALGGSWIAVYDHDGDGLDDAVIFYPDGAFVFQGSTSKTLLDRNTNKGVFPSTWAFYAVPLVADFLGSGQRQMLYGASAYMLALLDHQGDPLWQDGPASGTPAILPGLGDADGDGRPELLSPGHRRAPASREQEFRCYDAASGAVKWKLPLPGSAFGANNQAYPNTPNTPAVADLDGDGREEAVFAIGKTLYAVGASADGKQGEFRWTLEFPDILGPAAIADADGSGQAQIIVVCADGNVYGVGPAGSTLSAR